MMFLGAIPLLDSELFEYCTDCKDVEQRGGRRTMTSILSAASRRTAGSMAGVAVGTAVAYLYHLGASAPSSSTDDKAVASDPYASLPATDEPTHCTICRTNRNGPCKDLWRKFEYCMKDHPPRTKKEAVTPTVTDDQASQQQDQSAGTETSEQENAADEPAASAEPTGEESVTVEGPDDSEICNKYMIDWIPCIREHFMLYAMYSNQVDADYFNRTERLLEDVKEWKAEDIDADWSDYLSMLQSLKLNVVDVYSAAQRASEPLWEKGCPDPPAVEVFVRVNLQDDDLPIALCYARDDVGNIIGVGHFSQHDDQGNLITESSMTITFRPKATRCIRLYKVYEEELEEGTEASKPLTKRAYISHDIDLLQVALGAGKFTPHFKWEGGTKEHDN